MVSKAAKRTDLGELLGARLRAMRQAAGLTQVEFSGVTGLSQTRLSSLERGFGWGNLPKIWDARISAGLEPLGLFVPDAQNPQIAGVFGLLPGLTAGQLGMILEMARAFDTSNRA